MALADKDRATRTGLERFKHFMSLCVELGIKGAHLTRLINYGGSIMTRTEIFTN